jgi:hypothetical protein
MQMINVKNDFPSVNLVIYGGAEAPAVCSIDFTWWTDTLNIQI